MRTAVVAWLACAALLGCGGADEAGGVDAGGDAEATLAAGDAGPAGTFTEIYAAMFPNATNARCNFCHGMPASNSSNGKLSMGDAQAAAYAALFDKVSSSSACGGMPLVKPGQPEASLFLLKLMDPSPCGSRMPLGGAKPSDMLIGQVRSWIAAGAKNN